MTAEPTDGLAGSTGRRARFERVVLPSLDAAYRLARALTRSAADADDLVQEAMLRAYRSVDQLRNADARPWLLTIVRHCHFSAAGRRARDAARTPDQGEAAMSDEPADEHPGPEQVSLDDEQRRQFAARLARLSAEHRAVLVLREVEDLSYREIADVLGVPVGTVMSRLARAREAFREGWIAEHGAWQP
jgi:RNA polymerase sigma-70 factor (ECF subfamily)